MCVLIINVSIIIAWYVNVNTNYVQEADVQKVHCKM